MSTTSEKTVRELVVENPAAARILERLGIDYCCGANQPLQTACRKANLAISEVLNSLEMAEKTSCLTRPVRDWAIEPLADLIAHIENTHHNYTRDEIARVAPLFEKVCSVHGSCHPELLNICEVFRALAQELTLHMMKEEKVLFPYIVRMEEASIEKRPVVPAPFGSVQNPVAMMEHEHAAAGNALQAMRKASSGYFAPIDACTSYQTLYRALSDFEADLHQHIHLENNVLFPRAITLEEAHR